MSVSIFNTVMIWRRKLWFKTML